MNGTLSNRKKFLLLLFVAINLSPILWYDLRILSARGYIPEIQIKYAFILWAICILPYVAFFLTKIRLSQFRHPITILIILYIAVSLLSSSGEGWSVANIVGDFYKSLVFLSGFGVFSYYKNNINYFFIKVCHISIIFSSIRFAVFLYFFGNISRLYYGTVYDVISVLSSIYLFYKQKALHTYSTYYNKAKYVRAIFITICFLSILGQKRTSIIGIVFAFFLNFKIRYLFLSILIIIIMEPYWNDALVTIVESSRFATSFSIYEIRQAEFRRISEIEGAFELWTSSVKNILFGAGFGAEIYAYSSEEKGFGYVHSVHNTLAGTAARSGIIGFIVYVAIIIYAIFNVFSENTKFYSIAILAISVCSLFVYTFMDEIFVTFFLAGIMDNRSRKPKL